MKKSLRASLALLGGCALLVCAVRPARAQLASPSPTEALVAPGEENLMIQALADPKQRLAALDALAKPTVSEAAVEPIVPFLKDRDPRIRRAAATALGRIGKRPDLAGPALLELTFNPDPDPFVREAAQTAYAATKVTAASVIPVFIGWLSSPADWRRAIGCQRLSFFCSLEAEEADQVITALTTRRKDPAAKVRLAAIEALGGIIVNRHRPRVVPPGFPQPTEKDSIIAFEARGEKIVAALAGALKDRDETVRREAVEMLGQIGPTGTPLDQTITKALRSALQDRARTVRALARNKLTGFPSGLEDR